MTTALLAGRLPDLSDAEFTAFQTLIAAESGIWLADIKRALLIGRLGRRLRELDLDSWMEYVRLVKGDAAELVRMLDLITTNETHFFREPMQFERLTGPICEQWEKDAAAGQRQRKLRIWSAACSTGQEPFSLAAALLDRLTGSSWDVRISASDLSTRVLAQAQSASWAPEKAGGIPAKLREKYFMNGHGEFAGKLRAGAQLRGMVNFQRLNLLSSRFPFAERFDAIFCRNVLIYFNAPTRHQVIARLLDNLAPGGYLFLGHAESLAGTSFQLKSVAPAVYRLGG